MTPTAPYPATEAATLLGLLPAYTEIRVHHPAGVLPGLARDGWTYGGQRRFTMNSGTEWFVDADALRRIAPVKIEVGDGFELYVHE